MSPSNAKKTHVTETKSKIMATEENLSAVPEGLRITDMKDGRSRIRVQFDITYKGDQGLTPEGVSMTEPDLTIRLGQLLERHSRGKEIPMQEPLYFDTEIPSINDLTDVERYKEQLEYRLEETKNFIQQEHSESKAKTEAKEEKSSKASKKVDKSEAKQIDLEDAIKDATS